MSFPKHILIASLISITVFAACKKDDPVTPNPAAVVITDILPSAGQIVHKGDSVHISANVSYTTELHGYDVMITDVATGDTLFSNGQDMHNDHFAVQETWYNNVADAKDLRLLIHVHIDHDGNAADTAVIFKTQP